MPIKSRSRSILRTALSRCKQMGAGLNDGPLQTSWRRPHMLLGALSWAYMGTATVNPSVPKSNTSTLQWHANHTMTIYDNDSTNQTFATPSHQPPANSLACPVLRRGQRSWCHYACNAAGREVLTNIRPSRGTDKARSLTMVWGRLRALMLVGSNRTEACVERLSKKHQEGCTAVVCRLLQPALDYRWNNLMMPHSGEFQACS